MGRRGNGRGWGLNKDNQENYCEKHKRAPIWNSTNAIWALNDVMTQKGTNLSTRSIASLGIRVEQIRKTTTKYRRKSDVRHSITLLTPLLRIPYPKKTATRNSLRFYWDVFALGVQKTLVHPTFFLHCRFKRGGGWDIGSPLARGKRRNGTNVTLSFLNNKRCKKTIPFDVSETNMYG